MGVGDLLVVLKLDDELSIRLLKFLATTAASAAFGTAVHQRACVKYPGTFTQRLGWQVGR